MGKLFQKFKLLMWKNYVIQKNHKIQFVVELITPVVFSALLIAIRFFSLAVTHAEPTTFLPYRPDQFEPKHSDFPGRFNTTNTILYSPNDDSTNAIMTNVIDRFNTYLAAMNTSLKISGYATEAELVSTYIEESTDPVFAGVVFTTNTNSLNSIEYKIRLPRRKIGNPTSDEDGWYTPLTYPVFPLPGPRQALNRFGGEPDYYQNGFLFLQHGVDEAIVATAVGTSFESLGSDFNLLLNRYPYRPYIDDWYVMALQFFIPMILLLSFIYPVINITKGIVYEKEKRLKESMKMMGMPNYLHWSAWFCKSFLFLFVSTIFMTILLKIKVYHEGTLAVITYSDGFLFFLFLLTYVLVTIATAFFISTLFSKANSATIAAGIIFFGTYLPYIFLRPRYIDLSKGVKLLTALIPNTAMAYCVQIISQFEGTEAGLNWDTLTLGSTPDDTLTFLDVLIMLLVDTVLLFLAAFYIEGVWPGEFGVPLPWYFPVTKSYWMGSASTMGENEFLQVTPKHDDTYFEKEPTAAGKVGIRIQNLTKMFRKAKAVNGMYLNMYENQITALLGHNGAGKTTTMSMLTGLFPPSSGTAYINGFDIRSEIDKVRGSLGICPQHDVLFDELTVEEHLKFFCLLKGMKPKEVQTEIDRVITSVGLDPKRSTASTALSGGMKRKLSVAIALCAGSKVVLLDEPTSGMDPGARRSTWDLLQSEKKNRTIVLSTHFMDEADLLGDRIAIMAAGKVQCVGSSLFLKKVYGGGYHLIIVKESNCSVDAITQLLRKSIPDVEIEQNVGAELSYSLPETKSHLFPNMFDELETRREELGIASYGASITTMEEVFMKVGRMAADKTGGDTESNQSPDKSTMLSINRVKSFFGNTKSTPKLTNYNPGHNDPKVKNHTTIDNLHENHKFNPSDKGAKNEGFALVCQQFRAMFVKKMLHSVRNRKLLIFQTIIPILILFFVLLMVELQPSDADPVSLSMNLDPYDYGGVPVTTLACSTDEDDKRRVCDEYKRLAEESGDFESVDDFEAFILQKANADLQEVDYKYIVGMDYDLEFNNETLFPNSANPTIRSYFNNQPYHTPPLALNFLTNTLYRYYSNVTTAKISIQNHPLPKTLTEELNDASSFAGMGFQVGYNIAFGMAFMVSSFVVFLIKERETRAKHLQFVSGVNFVTFWTANFLFDVINYLIPASVLIILLLAFDTEDFNTVETLGNSFVLMLFYGFANIPLMYCFSFLFSVPSSGLTRMVLFNMFSAAAPIIAVTILQMPELGLLDAADVVEWFCMLLPQYSLGKGLIQISTNSQLHKRCPGVMASLDCRDPAGPAYNRQCCTQYPKSYLGWEPLGIGRNVLFLFLVGVVSIVGLFIYEGKVIERFRFRKSKSTTVAESQGSNSLEDSDVAAENKRIRSTPLTQLTKRENLILRDLSKNYGKFLAVDQLCLGVQIGECFGLLGINGAGKTSTFKMLTGDSTISGGDAYVLGESVKAEIKKVQQNFGYCPQFDALIDELTGRETIRLFARLRGIPEGDIDSLTENLAANLLFTAHIDKRTGAYSGGNKRKLSTAIALIGNPPLVYLDEPTTGMDPVARRHLWDCVTKVRDAGTSVVLTSHSMEECEALCTRLSIMVNGKFRCLGSPQHLKNKFGEGYTLIAQMATDAVTSASMKRSSVELGRRHSSVHVNNAQPWERKLQSLKTFIEDSFPGAVLKDIHPGFVHYHVGHDASVTWGKLFRQMEIAKGRFNLEAYSVGQTSLEQVFLNFTKAQANDKDD